MYQQLDGPPIDRRVRAKVYRHKAFMCRQLAATRGLSDSERAGYLVVADAYAQSANSMDTTKPPRGPMLSIFQAFEAFRLGVLKPSK
jgi:hypothetical protein